MGFFQRLKLRKAASAVADVAEGAGKVVRDKVREQVAGTAIEGVVNGMTAIDFRRDPVGGVIDAHVQGAKFLMSKEAAQIGAAAYTGGAMAGAVAAGGSKGAALMSLAQSGDIAGQLEAAATDYAAGKVDDYLRGPSGSGGGLSTSGAGRQLASPRGGTAPRVNASRAVDVPLAAQSPMQRRGLLAELLALFGLGG